MTNPPQIRPADLSDHAVNLGGGVVAREAAGRQTVALGSEAPRVK